MSRVQIPSAAPFALHVLARCCASLRDRRGIRGRAGQGRNPAVSAGKRRDVTHDGINGGYKVEHCGCEPRSRKSPGKVGNSWLGVLGEREALLGRCCFPPFVRCWCCPHPPLWLTTRQVGGSWEHKILRCDS